MTRYPAWAAFLTMTGFVLTLCGPATALGQGKENRVNFSIDVLEDCNTFSQNPPRAPLTEERGDVAIVGGTIYPEGTFPIDYQNAHDPSPSAKNLGKWLSRAVFLLGTDDFNAGGSPIVFTTMLYEFPDDTRSILSEGLVPNLGLQAERVVIGGTGEFRSAQGQVHMENIGFNSTGCFNYRFTFHLDH